MSDQQFKFISIVTGYLTFFVLSGIFEEKLYKEPYKQDSEVFFFNYPLVAHFFNNLLNVVISLTKLRKKRQSSVTPFKFKDNLMLGMYNSLIKWWADQSLQYLDYITKIIAKSCKSVTIIIVYWLYEVPFIGLLIKWLVNQDSVIKETSSDMWDIFKVGLSTASIILFNYEYEDDSGRATEINKSLLIGGGLLLASLFFDGVLALKERIINYEVKNNEEYKEYDESRLSWDYMYVLNVYMLAFSFLTIIYYCVYSDFSTRWHIFFFNPKFLIDISFWVIFQSCGHVCMFKFLDFYGPLSLSIIAGFRKILSIGLSVVFFGKNLTIMKFFALICGVMVIFVDFFKKTYKANYLSRIGPTSNPHKIR